MLALVARGDDGVDCAGVGVQELVGIALVLDLELLDAVVSLVADVDVEHDEMVEAVNWLIDWLGLVSDLKLVVLE